MGIRDLFSRGRTQDIEHALREVQSPESIKAHLEDAVQPLANERSEALRSMAGRFALGDEDLPNLLPAVTAAVVSRQLRRMTAWGSIQKSEIDQSVAFTAVLQGIGVRVAEHVGDREPRALEAEAPVDADPDHIRETAREVAENPVAAFAPGEEVWSDLEYSARMEGAAASRLMTGGFASAVPYEELLAFGYGVGCALDLYVPEWIDPVRERIAESRKS